MSSRTKWGFRLNDENEVRRGFGSENAVYAAAHEEAENWESGRIDILLYEGVGWSLYERLDLAQLAELRH